MLQVKQFLTFIISALIAYFVPDLANGGVEGVFLTFAALAPAVSIIAAKINTWRQWEDTAAWLCTGGVALVVSYLGYFLNLGIMADTPAWHPLLYAIGAFAVAALGFSLNVIKAVLAMIFDYSYKK